MAKWLGTWKGGRWYNDRQGKPVYVIERRGRTVRLNTHDEDLAVGELARFLEDPASFRPPVTEQRGAVGLTADLITNYLRYQRQERKVGEQHSDATKLYLVQWANALRGADLATITTKELRRHLLAWTTARKPRVIAIKGICTWLVGEDQLPADNAAARLDIPTSTSTRRPRRARSAQTIESVHARLSGATADVVLVLAKTGMHGEELARLVQRPGAVELVDHPAIKAVLTYPHKRKVNGKHVLHKQSIDQVTLDAVQRLVARGSVPRLRGSVDRALRRASLALAIDPPVTHGELRHSFTTLARRAGVVVRPEQGGASLEEIRAVIGHVPGSQMTSDRYEQGDVPPMLTVPVLCHPGTQAPTPES